MRVDDVEACAALLPPAFKAPDPIRSAIPELWRELLRSQSVRGGVVVDPSPTATVVAFGLTTFVDDGFVSDYLACPEPYLSARIYEAVLAGRSPILGARQLRSANSAGTLNFVILHFGLGLELPSARGFAAVTTAETGFRLIHAGYRVHCLLQEGYGSEEVRMLESAGLRMKSDFSAYYAAHVAAEPGPVTRPYLMGLTSDDPQSQRPGTAAAAVFQYNEPRFLFSPAEQRVLSLAVLDHSDEEIASEVGASRAAIKKIWRRSYERVHDIDPKLLGDGSDTERSMRGKEKRRNLVRYLRYHLEELRPFERRRQGSGFRRPNVRGRRGLSQQPTPDSTP